MNSDARRKDYYNENINLCEEGCIFVSFTIVSNTYSCKCNIKPGLGETAKELVDTEGKYVTNKMPEISKILLVGD